MYCLSVTRVVVVAGARVLGADQIYLVIISAGGCGQLGGAALCNMKMSESVRILIEPDNEDVTGAAACLKSVTVTWPRDRECNVVT